MAKNGQIFTIPAGMPFADTLVQSLLHNVDTAHAADISQTQILLPTRRGIRTLHESFVRQSKNRALILPRLQTFGDIDEDALSISLFGTPKLMNKLQDIAPAMPAMQRQILLARLIMRVDIYKQGFDSALKLARALGQFIDQIYIEELSFEALSTIVPENVADHWQITLEFLEILSIKWPEILAEKGMIDTAQRRSRLIHLLSDFWETNKPTHSIIAAGSTGSVPATARLLNVISNLPNGQIILPGLDQHMNDEAWEDLEPSHPQYGLKTLLGRLDCPKENVQIYSTQDTYAEPEKARTALASIMLTPAAHTAQWQNLSTDKSAQNTIETGIQNISYMPCEDMQQEALSIALIMRETLEEPHKTAALITPDRLLARSVTAILKRWDINIDDSAGENLIHRDIGVFLRLTLDVTIQNFAPTALLALLKHPLCMSESDAPEKLRLISRVEKQALRGIAPKDGLNGLITRLEEQEGLESEITFIKAFQAIFAPLENIMHQNKLSFSDMIKTHISVAEQLHGAQDANALWRGADGQSAANFIAELLVHAGALGEIHPLDYRATFTELLSSVTLRPAYGTHPRLKILGQLEARLSQADLTILGGLNEGTWPTSNAHDPWMSRTMRNDFGLPPTDRSVGLAAHDFYQAFCAPHIIITRAERISGAMSIPSRWITRLETILKAAKITPTHFKTAPHRAWAEALDCATDITPTPRPAPTPPLHSRPNGLSATNVETWLKDPYTIYAKYILKLRPLDALEKEIDHAEHGKLLHYILELYGKNAAILNTKTKITDALTHYAHQAILEMDMAAHLSPFWWPRFERLAEFFAETEISRARDYSLSKAETMGKATLPDTEFTLSARVDRIDRHNATNTYSIIDYKSGGTYSPSKIADGSLPQLPVTGLILKYGGFEKLSNARIGGLAYWTLKGGRERGNIKELNENIDEALETVETNLRELIACFENPETPYLCTPRAHHMPRFNDYTHLARTQEWSAEDEDSSEGSALA